MAAWRDGVVAELRRQLDDARREAADLRVAVALGATPGPSRSYASVLAGRSDGVPTTPYSQDRPHVPSSQQPVPEPDYRSPVAPTPPSASHVAFLNLIGTAQLRKTPREQFAQNAHNITFPATAPSQWLVLRYPVRPVDVRKGILQDILLDMSVAQSSKKE
ncbi:hypothetical protein HPB50_019023 [Hyalomma asiaticum]|uniref:Uncharacterized protein n=1 Tax=Hyalomma asiaticum TaxID=266040 RepID=A0ACB7T2Q8_HYAAI|nr:hypothetical protein HPB50_019023 [Hyalomma asiaticum]